MFEKRWDEAESKLSPELVTALKELYAFYGDNIYKWFAIIFNSIY